MTVIHVGLSSWIIQDGNYGDFTAGERGEFALEVHSRGLERANLASPPGFEHVSDCTHEVRGTVIFANERCWAIDFGAPAFQEARPPSWAATGVSVSGRVAIGIDPFFYFERLKDEPGMPSLTRRWLIRRIVKDVTPWDRGRDPSCPRLLQRAGPPVFAEVPATDAWSDEALVDDYVLECELLGGATG